MIGQRRVLAMIPARGGSKGLPGKNILPVNGRPLLAYTVDAAAESRYIDKIILSSDDEEIMAAARQSGCDVPFTRPAELASDSATTVDVALHAADMFPEFDIMIVLQPTSPLRTTFDIDEACRIFLESHAPSCISVNEVDQNPFWMFTVNSSGRLERLIPQNALATRRQDLPSVYIANGSVYIVDIKWLRDNRTFVNEETVSYIMPSSRSIDIDTIDDFENFQRIIHQQ